MPIDEYAAFEALNPFFEIVQKGLRGLVDGEHYFDTIADDAFFELKGCVGARRVVPVAEAERRLWVE